MAVHVRYNFLYISLPFSAKQQWPNSALPGERDPRRSISKFYISGEVCIVFHVQFGDEFAKGLNKSNDFRVSWDSQIKYKFIFAPWNQHKNTTNYAI